MKHNDRTVLIVQPETAYISLDHNVTPEYVDHLLESLKSHLDGVEPHLIRKVEATVYAMVHPNDDTCCAFIVDLRLQLEDRQAVKCAVAA